MKHALKLLHPLQWAIVVCVSGCVVVLVVGQNWWFLATPTVKTWSGAALLTTMAYQCLLFWKKLRGLPIDRADKDRHRKASYLSVILLLLHLSESVQNWQSILLVSFVLTAISAFFARAVMKPNSRAAVFWQVFFIHYLALLHSPLPCLIRSSVWSSSNCGSNIFRFPYCQKKPASAGQRAYVGMTA